MRTLQSLAVTILLLAGRPALAGVVMSEREIQSGIDGVATLNKTVYVQGRKQKIETPSRQTIIDLDQGRAYVIDLHRRSYIEMPFPSEGGDASALGVKLGTLTLKKTGASRWVAGYSCDEYQGVARMDRLEVLIDQCISAEAPGAPELSEFEKALNARIGRSRSKASLTNEAGGVALEQTSTIKSQRTPIARGGVAYAPLVTSRTQVSKIHVADLPAATFEPPADFRKIAPFCQRRLEV